MKSHTLFSDEQYLEVFRIHSLGLRYRLSLHELHRSIGEKVELGKI